MAKLNLNALSTLSTEIKKEVAIVEEQTKTIITSENDKFENPAENKIKITLKNGRVSSITQNNGYTPQLRTESIEEVPAKKELQKHEPPKATEKISLETKIIPGKQPLLTENKISEEQNKVINNDNKVSDKNITDKQTTLFITHKNNNSQTQNTNIQETHKKEEGTVPEVFTIQDADTKVSIQVETKDELFTNYNGSYTEETKQNIKVEKNKDKVLTDIKKEEKIKKEITSDNKIKDGKNQTTPLQKINKSISKKKKYALILTSLTSIVMIGGIGIFFGINQMNKGNIQEIPKSPSTSSQNLNQEYKDENVNTNTSSIIDNNQKNDIIKNEIKKYLLNKYKSN